MTQKPLPEVWLRGPIPEIPPLLQPVAHALLQACEEAERIMTAFPEEKLWISTAGAASAGFHLQHITGVVDRLFTYARGESLSEIQLKALALEDQPPSPGVTADQLVQRFNDQVAIALKQLKHTNEDHLTDVRGVGRKQIPSTVLGLLFHAAEHTQRHLGQLLVTVKVLKAQ